MTWVASESTVPRLRVSPQAEQRAKDGRTKAWSQGCREKDPKIEGSS